MWHDYHVGKKYIGKPIDYYFVHDGIFYNKRHQRVHNVIVEFPVIENVSKYYYEQVVEAIRSRLHDWHCLRNSLDCLKSIKQPDEKTEVITLQLEESMQKIMEKLRADFAHYEE